MPASCRYCGSSKPCKEEAFISPNSLLGPSIEEVIVTLLFLLFYKLCENLGIVHKPNMKGVPFYDQDKDNDMNSWLSKEIKELAVQLSMLGYDLNDPGLCPTPSMLQARKFVLNRLAEIMEKKDEIERSSASSGSASNVSATTDSLCS